MPRRNEQALAWQILELMVDAGNTGMELQELAAKTRASVDEVEDMVKRLHAGGYLRPKRHRRTKH